jgi:hypothetical protein
MLFLWLCLGLLVDGSDAIDLEGLYIDFLVVCLSFFLELVRFLHFLYHIFSKSRLLLEIGGKYKGIHPHLSLHHFMLTCYWFNKGFLREV